MEVFTIGYEGLRQDSFIAHLKYWKIDVVADVRDRPLSRKKGFSLTPLKDLLKEHGIEYLSCKDLGAPKELREELYSTWNYQRFFKKYKKTILNGNHSIDHIYDMILDNRRVALLCFERNPDTCHRKVVAEKLKGINGNGMKIVHIKPL